MPLIPGTRDTRDVESLHAENICSTIEAKHVVGAYEIINAFCFFFNCYGKVLPTMGHLALWTSLVSFFVILVAVPAKASSHQHARFVFANFVNNTGWSNDGIGRSLCSFACLAVSRRVYQPSSLPFSYPF